MNDIMLDIEALGEPIVQIGALWFDRLAGETGESFSVNIRLESCLAAGLQVQWDPVKFWLEQAKGGNPCTWMHAPVDLRVALERLGIFVKPAKCIWCHQYDSYQIKRAARACGMPHVIPGGKFRCIRTLLDLAGCGKPGEACAKPHDALEDCRYQVGYCMEAFQKLAGNDSTATYT